MCVIGLLSSDIYLPALPIMAKTLNVKESDVQLTLTSFLLGLSIGQLIYGPLSDRLGRKKVLLIGMLVFIFATLCCSFSSNLYELIIFRFFQAQGACSGMVISRAIASDLYSRTVTAKIFTTIFPVVGASSAVAPILGGYLTDSLGWQACFYFLALYGFVLFLLINLNLKESKKSLVVDKQNKINRFLEMFEMLKHRLFLGFTLIISSAYAAYFAYIAATPFLFYRYGFNPHQIGYFFILLSIFYISGNLIARKLINHISINKGVFIGIVLFMAGSLAITVSSFLGNYHNNPLGLIIPMSLLTAGNGFIFPLCMASTVTLFPTSAGTASGLMGFLQLGAAAFAVGIVGHLTNNQEFPLALFLTLNAIIASVSFYFFIIKGAYIDE